MTERRFYQKRWRVASWRGLHWLNCGHRHRSPKAAGRCPISHRGDVFAVTERRVLAWDPTYSRVEEAP